MHVHIQAYVLSNTASETTLISHIFVSLVNGLKQNFNVVRCRRILEDMCLRMAHYQVHKFLFSTAVLWLWLPSYKNSKKEFLVLTFTECVCLFL